MSHSFNRGAGIVLGIAVGFEGSRRFGLAFTPET